MFNIGSFAQENEAGPVTATIADAAGNPFRIVSMEVDTGAGLGTQSTFTIQGYNNNVLVVADTVDTSVSDGAGSVSYTKVGPAAGRGGTLTFDGTWATIDEIRLIGTDIVFAVDQFDFEASNIAPTVDLNTGTGGTGHAASFVESANQGTGPADGVLITNAPDITDPEADTITQIVVNLTNSQGDTGERVFLSVAFANVNYTLDSATQITITNAGGATQAQMEAALAAVRYQNNSDTPNTTTRTIDVQVSDAGGSTTSQATVSITASNDDPTGSGVPALVTFTEDTPARLDLSGVTFADVDNPPNVTVRISVTSGTLSVPGSPAVPGTGTGTLTLFGPIAGVLGNLANPNLILYTPAANVAGTNAATLTVTISDNGNTGLGGGGTITLGTGQIDITPVNDAPTLTGGGTLAAVNEDTTSPPGAALSTLGITAADVDGTVVGYAIVGNTANAGTQGAWQYSTNGGTNWFSVGTVADGATALALDPATLVRFVPVANFNGAPPALTIRAIDSTYGGGFSTTAGTETRVSVDTTTNGGATAISAATATIATTITAVNDDPTGSGVPALVTFTEDTPARLDLSGVTFADVDNPPNVTVRISVTSGTLSVPGSPAVPGTGTGTLTLFGPIAGVLGNLANPNLILYTPAANVAGTNAATLTVTISDNGNTGLGGGGTITLGTGQIDITPVNDVPTVTTTGGSAAYTEGAAGVPVDPGATLADVDNATLASATVSITAGFQAGADVLAFVNDGATMGNVTASYVAGTGVLTLTSAGATATLAEWTAALRAVTYANTSEDPSTAARTVSVVVNDGDAASTAATRGVTVTAVNDAPTNNPAFGFVNTGASTETAGLVTITNAMLNEGDPDDSGAGVTYTVTTTTANGTLFLDLNSDNVVDTFEERINGLGFTQAQLDNGLIKYLHGGGGGSSDSFVFSVADGGENGSTPLTGQTFTITIAARPVLAINGGAPAHVEDAGATTVAPNLTLSDADSANLTGATVTITDRVVGDVLGFTDQNGITGSYNAGTGVLTLGGTATLANYQAALRSITYSTTNDNPATGAGNADRVISFTVTDGTLNSTAQAQTVGVTNANDAPTLTATGASPTFAEGGAAQALLAGGAAVTDVDIVDPAATGTVTGATLTVGLSSGVFQAQDLFRIANVSGITFDAGTGTVTIGGQVVAVLAGGAGGAGVVTFTAQASLNHVNAVLGALTYANSGDNPTQFGTNATRAYEVVYNDGAANTAAVGGTVTITADNDAEGFTGTVNTAAYVENAAAIPLLTAATVTQVDSPGFAGGSLTAAFAAYQPGDVLSVASIGTGVGQIGVAGADVTFGNVVIGSITSDGQARALTITLGANATHAAVQALALALRYESTSDNPTNVGGTLAPTRSVTVSLTDDGNTGAGGAQTSTLNGVLTITPVNDSAVVGGTLAATIVSGATVTITNTMLAEADPDDGSGVIYTVVTAPVDGVLFNDANENDINDDGLTLIAGSTFTQGDVNQGRIRNVHGGAGDATDTFVFNLKDFAGAGPGVDGSVASPDATFTITVSVRPVIAVGGGAPAHVEDAAATVVAPALTIADSDSATMAGATVTITDRVVGDVLGFVDQNGITGTYDGATGVLTLTGTATRAQYEAALRSITYATTNDNPATGAGNGDRVIAFTVNDGALTSTAQTQTVTVTNANDAPTLNPAVDPVLVGVTEDPGPPTNGSILGSTPVSALVVGMADVDTGAVQGVAVTTVSAQGTLWFTVDGGATWTQATGVASGNALLLESDGGGQNRIYFQPAAHVNGTISDAITFRGWDRTGAGVNGGRADTTTNGGGTAFSTATDTAAITIAAVNDAPVLTVPAAIAVTEDVATALTGIAIADVDAGASAVTATLSVPSGTLAATSAGGVVVGGTPAALTLTGMVADINAFVAASGVTFTTAANATAPVVLTVTVNDGGNTGAGGALADTETVTLTVTAVDDAPTLGGLALGQAVTDKTTIAPFAAATIADVDSAAVTVTVTLDVAAKGSFTTLAGFTDAGGGVYTFTGAPAAAQAALRALVFTPAENRVAPGATETTTFAVRVADATTPTQGTASVVATSVNDAPALGGLVAGVATLDSGTVAPFSAATVADPDSGQPLTVTVTLDDAAKGAFTAASLTATGFASAGGGVYILSAPDAAAAQAALRGLVFAPAANRVAPGLTETTAFTVAVSDGAAPAAVDATASVVATSVNDAPTAVVAIPAQAVEAGRPFSLVLPAAPFADVDVGDAVTVTVEGLPAGLSYNAASRTISGTAPTQGVTAFSVVGTDAAGARTTIVVGFTAGAPPIVTETGPPPPPPVPDLPPPPVQIVPAPQHPAFVPDPPPLAEDFGGVGGGVPVAAPDPIVGPAPIGGPVLPRPSFFLSTPDAGVVPGFGIRADTPIGGIAARAGGGPISFALPTSTFVVENSGVRVLVGATLADGSPLPAWVEFDPATGTFRIDAPPGFTGELNVVVSAALPSGESASSELRITIEEQEGTGTAPEERDGAEPGDPQRETAVPVDPAIRTAEADAVPLGKPAFSEVVKAASRGAWATQGDDFLDNLIAVLPAERPSGDNRDGSRDGREAA